MSCRRIGWFLPVKARSSGAADLVDDTQRFRTDGEVGRLGGVDVHSQSDTVPTGPHAPGHESFLERTQPDFIYAILSNNLPGNIELTLKQRPADITNLDFRQ